MCVRRIYVYVYNIYRRNVECGAIADASKHSLSLYHISLSLFLSVSFPYYTHARTRIDARRPAAAKLTVEWENKYSLYCARIMPGAGLLIDRETLLYTTARDDATRSRKPRIELPRVLIVVARVRHVRRGQSRNRRRRAVVVVHFDVTMTSPYTVSPWDTKSKFRSDPRDDIGTEFKAWRSGTPA